MTQDTQKKVAIGGFLVLAAGILYYQLRDDSPPPRPAQPVITTAPGKHTESIPISSTPCSWILEMAARR